MVLQKNDFIEIEFTARTASGEMFDSNIKENLEKINLKYQEKQAKPHVFALNQNMFVQGVDDFLVGKEENFQGDIEIPSEKAFGKRDSKNIQRMPLKVFHEHKLNPVPGIPFNFDGKIGKVLAVSGGRVIVDFNHPLAGKDVVYNVKILRTVKDLNEKIKSLIDFLFKKNYQFEVNDKKLILNVSEQEKKFVEMFKDKFKDILGLDLEVKSEQSS